MKKICFLNGNMSRAGGTERVTSMIANELVKDSAYEIHVLSVTNPTMTSFFELHSSVYQATLLRKEDVDLKYDYFKIVKKLRRYLKTHQIDILIEVDVICNLYTIPATCWTKVKTISWEHFNYYSNNGSRLRDLSRKLTKYFSTHIVTLTEQDRRNYQEHLGIKDKITCIYNPIEKIPETMYQSESKQIISVGRLMYQKGFDMLCEVAKEVLTKHSDWTWLIIGEGAERPMLEKKIKEYHLEGRLVLTGNQKEMSHYYQESAFFVMTSRYEGLPMTLLEAKSYRLPIISFDCQTGPAEIIQDGVNGYLVTLEDCEGMISKIEELLNSREKLVNFSNHSQCNIEKFNKERVIMEWRELLNAI